MWYIIYCMKCAELVIIYNVWIQIPGLWFLKINRKRRDQLSPNIVKFFVDNV